MEPLKPKPKKEIPLIEKAIYVCSCVRVDKAPDPDRPEFAFIGRSNVGKSSLINMLTGVKDLAKVSNTPGKTQTLNYFNIDDVWYMVDLPGYGYARVSQTLRAKWEDMISYYLRNRESLVCLFILVDSNIPPQKADLEFMVQVTKWQVPFAVVLTKTDRLNQSQRIKNINAIENELKKHWKTMPNVFYTSADRGFGRKDLLDFVNTMNEQSK